MITIAQIRAARALIGWKQAELARASGISEVAIKNMERGATDPRVSTLAAIERAFDEAGGTASIPTEGSSDTDRLLIQLAEKLEREAVAMEVAGDDTD